MKRIGEAEAGLEDVGAEEIQATGDLITGMGDG